MSTTELKPERITKPIQLLAAWLAGLFSINDTFLLAATHIGASTWQSAVLTCAAVINVPLFLIAVFVLQTRFRPELQEDSYYSSYLSQKTNEVVTVNKEAPQTDALVLQRISEIEQRLLVAASSPQREEQNNLLSRVVFGVNKFLPDIPAIADRLADFGVIEYTSFGGDVPPEGRNVSISRYLNAETIREVVKLAGALGFTTYNLWDRNAESAMEDVLLGSYGEGNLRINVTTRTR